MFIQITKKQKKCYLKKKKKNEKNAFVINMFNKLSNCPYYATKIEQ